MENNVHLCTVLVADKVPSCLDQILSIAKMLNLKKKS